MTEEIEEIGFNDFKPEDMDTKTTDIPWLDIPRINWTISLFFTNIPEYADNATALTWWVKPWWCYRTWDVLKVVH